MKRKLQQKRKEEKVKEKQPGEKKRGDAGNGRDIATEKDCPSLCLAPRTLLQHAIIILLSRLGNLK